MCMRACVTSLHVYMCVCVCECVCACDTASYIICLQKQVDLKHQKWGMSERNQAVETRQFY